MKTRITCILVFLLIVLVGFQSVSLAAEDTGYDLTASLWAKAILKVPGSPVTLIWKPVGTDITPSGAQVVSGYFYADPNDFAYGSEYNPELFVKIYIDPGGWANIAFNHVTVDDVDIYSAHGYNGTFDQTGTATLDSRLIEHQYNGVSIDSSLAASLSSPEMSILSGSSDGGSMINSGLWAKAVLQPSTGPVTLVWKMIGSDTTISGDRVVSGYFYADPDDFPFGSEYNPEVFVKIYIAANGWANMAYNHVTVDDVSVYSAHNYTGSADQTGTATLTGRLAEHQFNGVTIATEVAQTTIGTDGGTLVVPTGSPYLSGTALDVPQGALDQVTDLTLQAEPADTMTATPLEVAQNDGQLYLALVDYAMQHLDDGYLHPMYSPLFILKSASFSGPAIHLGPDKLEFNTPATLTIPYDCMDITSADKTMMPLLRSSDGTWEIPEDFSFSSSDDVALVNIPHFSIVRYIKNFFSLAWNLSDVIDDLENAQTVIPQDTLKQSVLEAICSETTFQTELSDMPDETTLLEELFIGATPGATSADTDKLKNWILSQEGQIPNNSIRLSQLFAEALSQHDGNIYKALVTAHGLLSLDRGKAYLDTLIEKPRKDNGDQSGARYHFFGAALHAFVHEYHYERRSILLDLAKLDKLLDPEGIVTIEEGIISGDIVRDTVEYAIDLKGVEFGRELYRQVQGKTRDEVISTFGIDISIDCSEAITWMTDNEVKMIWDQANQYCISNGGRLPTSLELRQAWLDGGSQLYPNHTPGFKKWIYWGESHPSGSMADTFVFSYGMLSGKFKNEEAYVRCVQ